MDKREKIARIVGGPAFRPAMVNGPFESPAVEEKWLRARDAAYDTADRILVALSDE